MARRPHAGPSGWNLRPRSADRHYVELQDPGHPTRKERMTFRPLSSRDPSPREVRVEPISRAKAKEMSQSWDGRRTLERGTKSPLTNLEKID